MHHLTLPNEQEKQPKRRSLACQGPHRFHSIHLRDQCMAMARIERGLRTMRLRLGHSDRKKALSERPGRCQRITQHNDGGWYRPA